jgi:hypothetical protein
MPTRKRNKRRGRTRRKKGLRGGRDWPKFSNLFRKSNVIEEENDTKSIFEKKPDTFDMDEKEKRRNNEANEALGSRDNSIWSIEGEEENERANEDEKEDYFMGSMGETKPPTPSMDLGEEVKNEMAAEDMAKKDEEHRMKKQNFNDGRAATQKKRAVSKKALKQLGVSQDEFMDAEAISRLGMTPEEYRPIEQKKQNKRAYDLLKQNTTWLGGKRTRRRRKRKR